MLNLKNRKGVALIAVYLALVVLLIFVVVFFNVSTSQNMSANFFARRAQAFDLAEAGVDRAIYWMRSQSSTPTGNYTNPWGSVQSLGSGTYSVTITDLGAVSSVRRYKIASIGTVGSVTRTVTNYIERDNYARYIWFTNNESFQGSNVWFWSTDTLNGPVHTNGHFNIYGTPTFTDEVESSDSYITYYNNGSTINSSDTSNSPYDVPVFGDGITLGADSITMPTQDLNLRSASTSTGGVRLSGNTTVVLKSDGTMNVTNSKKGWSSKSMSLPTNGALFVDSGNLTISGTLKGQLSVGASGDVVIAGSILYATDPRVTSTSTDVLGIVAEGDVVIPSTASTNLEIDASIMALDTSLYLENWSTSSAKGTLTVYGGIIQKTRGPVGTFNASTNTLLSGYRKNYTYDSRLLSNPPPFVPTTNDYVSLSWEDQ